MSTRAMSEQPERRDLALWYAVLAPGLAWGVDLVFKLLLVTPACNAGTRAPLFALTAATSLVAISAGVVAARALHRLGKNPDRGPSTRHARGRDMALSGVLLSPFFLLVILAQTIPIVSMGPCE